ncbi:MAG: monofunctional biosynthetic peptidoglycan transglycosylase [Ideonella sp.]|jgi:monofunctional glycosyltransferase|nr:monofunctional biosynthetic peptidoglycan transglycosylase [Ideonella sp.]MBL0149725.1 monofunctional biosynthetic peptidoglycan transglycosylase [Ideonella sp.]
MPAHIAGWRGLRQAIALLALCTAALQLVWVARIALMNVLDPQSTTFQRSEIWRLFTEKGQVAWGQQWIALSQMSPQLPRAVIASEDAGFTDHGGVEWDALENAWARNQRAQARATHAKRPPKVVGGSTISQQLAKNLFLSGERTWPRKAQEFVLTLTLEALLSKRRILEIYLNNVEFGEGLFGVQAASGFYFRRDASRLDALSAARLAVMLPAPKRFERQFGSGMLQGRAATIAARMPAVEVP